MAGQQGHNDNAQHNHQGQPDAVVHHDAEDAEQGHRRNGHLREALADHLAQGVDIVGVKAHDVAVAVGVKVADGQILHVVKHLLTHLCQGALGNLCHQLGVAHVGDQADNVHGQENGQQLCNPSGCRGPVAGGECLLHDGDGVLHENGGHGADYGVHQDTAKGNGQKHRIESENGAD